MADKNSNIPAPSGIFDIHDAAAAEAVASQLPGRENGPADAYRHLLGAAELSRQYKERTARFILDANELFFFESKEAKEMDYHNNAIGIEIGKTAKNWDEVIAMSRAAIDAAGIDGKGDRPDAVRWLPPDQWRKNPKYEHDPKREMPTEETNWYTNPNRPDGIDWIGGYVPNPLPRKRLPDIPTDMARSRRETVPLAAMTEAEMRRAMKSDAYWTAGHPEHRAAQQAVRAWHDNRYGTAPSPLDAAGRMRPVPAAAPHIARTSARADASALALPRRMAAAQPPAPGGLFTNDDIQQKATPDQENAQALDLLLRFARDALRSGDASGLPDAVDRGLGGLFPATPPGRPAPWRQAVQDTINDLAGSGRHATADAEPLRDDGEIGPRTVAAFGRTLTGAGPDRFVRRLAQNLGFA
ncbi:MAG: hypothetical protein AB7G39_00145 [Alphaproteobacteria bacterium]